MSKSIAFFGATGGCTSATLISGLKAGYACSALVRDASKLYKLLEDRGIQASKLPNLRVVEGSAKDVDACSQTLIDPQTNTCVDIIIYGIGAPMDFSNPLSPKHADPHVCAETSEAIIKALKVMSPQNPPLMAIISTTGISSSRDLPLLMKPFYHYMLSIPHDDKAILEKQVEEASKSVIRDWIMIRPSLLYDTEATYNKTKAGFEGRQIIGGGRLTQAEGGTGWKGTAGLPIGYGIGRTDVGNWIFEEVIVNGGGEWVGKRVNLTY